jgi:hypothetical protein
MIFRLTAKLARKIGLDPLPVLPYNQGRGPLLDWNAHQALRELFGPETAKRKIIDSLIADEEEGAGESSRPLES